MLTTKFTIFTSTISAELYNFLNYIKWKNSQYIVSYKVETMDPDWEYIYWHFPSFPVLLMPRSIISVAVFPHFCSNWTYRPSNIVMTAQIIAQLLPSTSLFVSSLAFLPSCLQAKRLMLAYVTVLWKPFFSVEEKIRVKMLQTFQSFHHLMVRKYSIVDIGNSSIMLLRV